MRKNKIYTKTGDKGLTSLFSGRSVLKHDLRINAYGCIDELISWLGKIRSYPIDEHSKNQLIQIQHHLMTISSELANEKTEESKLRIPLIQEKEVFLVEEWIDEIIEQLPDLKEFIIPGGNLISSDIHIARTVARRSEREISLLKENVKISATILMYLNRLSDYLFSLSRKIDLKTGNFESKWKNFRK